jgi:hypothetical protein
MAKLAVRLIRKIWRAHYNKVRRFPEDGYDAHEIAAAYFEVDIADVTKKPSSGTMPTPDPKDLAYSQGPKNQVPQPIAIYLNED